MILSGMVFDRRWCSGIFVFFFSFFSVNGQTVDYKAAFSNLLKGRTARIVWISPQNQIWGMDTKDGMARQITSNTDLPANSARLHDPSMTWDQSRIIFTNMNNMSVYSVNWDGTGFKKIATGYLSAYAWQGQNKHWIIVSLKNRSTDTNTRVFRMNIDNPSDTVLLWSKTSIGLGESFHASLSVDGTRMAENYPHPRMGIAIVPNGKVNYFSGAEICVPSISRDNECKSLCFNHDHTNFVIMDSTGRELLNKSFIGNGGLPFTAVNAPSDLRWSTDQDIAAVDDYVVRISDLKNVQLSVSGNKAKAVDVAISVANPVLIPLLPHGVSDKASKMSTSFDIMGKIIRNPSACGIQIVPGQNRGMLIIKVGREIQTGGDR